MVACAHVFCLCLLGVLLGCCGLVLTVCFVLFGWFGCGVVLGLWLYDFDFLYVVYSVVFEESEGFFEGVCLGECWDL